MNARNATLAVALGGALMLSASSWAEAGDGAKALFFNPNTDVGRGVGAGRIEINPDARAGGGTGTATPTYAEVTDYYDRIANPGVSYWIELVRAGSPAVKRVTDRRVFTSGDKIRIHVAGNAPGHLYIMSRGTTGSERVLPVSAKSGSQVLAGQEYTVPSDGGWLKFDQNQGIETLRLVFAPRSPKNPDPRTADVQQVASMYDQFSASKGLISYVEDGAKDLIVEGAGPAAASVPVNRSSAEALPVDETISSAPASYAVNSEGKPVAVEIQLKHQ